MEEKEKQTEDTHLSAVARPERRGVDALEWLWDLCADHVSIYCGLEVEGDLLSVCDFLCNTQMDMKDTIPYVRVEPNNLHQQNMYM